MSCATAAKDTRYQCQGLLKIWGPVKKDVRGLGAACHERSLGGASGTKANLTASAALREEV